MDIHHLEVFCKCVELGSFSEAAIALGIKQSTISAHIKSLESEISVRLFDRRKKRICVTPAGRVLYQQGLKVIASRQEAIAALHSFLGKIEGEISLGASTIPATYILPNIISRFMNTYHQVVFHLAGGNTQSVLRDVSLEKVELGAVGSLPDETQFASRILGTDELLLAYSPVHFPQIDDVALSFEQVKAFPFILREEGSGTRRLIESVLLPEQLGKLRIVAQIDGIDAVKQAVMAGIGVSLIPKAALAFEAAAGILRAAPLSDRQFVRKFYLVHLISKTLSPVARAFWNFAGRAGRPSFSPTPKLRKV